MPILKHHIHENLVLLLVSVNVKVDFMRKKDNKACYKPTRHLFLDTSDKEATKGKYGLQYIREIIRYINPGKNLFEFDE